MSTGGSEPDLWANRHASIWNVLMMIIGCAILCVLAYRTLWPNAELPIAHTLPLVMDPTEFQKVRHPDPDDEFPIATFEGIWKEAVERARFAELKSKCDVARENLSKIKDLETSWTAKSNALRTGPPGRRIAGSPEHVRMAYEALQQERLFAFEVAQWEEQLAPLVEPIDTMKYDPSHEVPISIDFVTRLDDLGRKLSEAVSRLEAQERLLDVVIQEAAFLEPNSRSLDEVLTEHRAAEEKAFAEKLVAARQAARAATESRELQRVARLEVEVVEAESNREEAKIRAEKERIEQLTRDEAEQVESERKLREAQQRAIVDGLAAEAERTDETLRLAQLEREFQRDLPQIQSYLVAFTTPGFGHRSDGTKGPMSLGFLEAKNCLQPTSFGMGQLGHYAHTAENDRPPGAIPIGNATYNYPALERAQQLLIKYGEVLVTKGMLDP